VATTEGQVRLSVLIASPLEEEHVCRIADVAPDRVDIVYEPDLLPPTRYVADHKGVSSYRHTAEQSARWRAHISTADILFDFPFGSFDGKGRMDGANNVKWIQTTSTGVGQLVKRLGLHNTDLLVTTARGVHAGPLAEFVFFGLLCYVKRLNHLVAEQRVRSWNRFCGDELAGKTLGIIGAGEIGQRVATVARCFGMGVVMLASPGSSKTVLDHGVDELFQSSELHTMLSKVDAVVLAIPHTPDTENLIDETAIAAMKHGSALINVARGQVIDEAALIEALRSGQIAFAALDVFQVEPLPSDSPLWSMSNVLVSPHSASTVFSENSKIVDIFCHNLRCYVDGRYKDMRNVLDKARMY